MQKKSFVLIRSILMGLCSRQAMGTMLQEGRATYPDLLIRIDPTRNLTFDQFRQENSFKEGRPIVGFKDVALWVKFTVDYPGPGIQRMVFEDQWARTDPYRHSPNSRL